MFGLFKKDRSLLPLGRIDGFSGAAIGAAHSAALLMMQQTNTRDKQAYIMLLLEGLTFTVSSVAFQTLQSYKFQEGHEMLNYIRLFQREFARIRELPDWDTPEEYLEGRRQALLVACTEDFLDRVAKNLAKDYQAAGVSDAAFEDACCHLGSPTSLMKYGGVGLFPAVFTARAFEFLSRYRGQLGLTEKRELAVILRSFRMIWTEETAKFLQG